MKKKQRRPQQKSTKLKAVFWENKLNRQTTNKTHQEKKGEESNQQNQKCKWRNHNRQHRNMKDHKSPLIIGQ